MLPQSLEAIPDWDDQTEEWLQGVLARTALVRADTSLVAFQGCDLPVPRSGPVGRFALPTFRRFVTGLLAADLAVYRTPADVVDIERLAYLVAKFPQGFRLWCAEEADGILPVGYSGFYPISSATFHRVATGVPPLEDRFLHPVPIEQDRPFLYIFNFSIATAFRRPQGDGGARVVQALDDDLHRVNPAGLAAITVSPDGQRVVQTRWALRQSAELSFLGERELVYTRRLP